MTEYKISLIPGDGIGPELTEATLKILEATQKKFGLKLNMIYAEAVSRFLGLAQAGHIVASCLHADTLPELKGILEGDLGVPPAALGRVDLIVFMHVRHGGSGYERRVAAVYGAAQDDLGNRAHTLLYQWKSSDDTFAAAQEPVADPAMTSAARDLLGGLVKKGVRDFGRVRKEIAGFLRQ